MSDNLNIIKSILDLKFEITQMRLDLGNVQEECKLLLCQFTKYQQASSGWDFNILNEMITNNLHSITEHSKQLNDIDIHLTNIDNQYNLISKQDIFDYSLLIDKWNNIETVLTEHAQSLEALSYRVSLCDCQTLHNKIEELDTKFTKITTSIPDFNALTDLVNSTVNDLKTSINDISTIKSTIDTIQTAIDNIPVYDQDLLLINQSIDSINQSIETFENSLNEFEDKFNTLQNSCGELDNKILNVNCAIDEIKNKNDEQDKIIIETQQLAGQVDNKVESLSSQVTELMAKVEALSCACNNIDICKAWPIGSYFITSIAQSPTDLIGCGIWEQVNDVFLLASGKYGDSGTIGGEDKHLLTIDEIPSHSHLFPGDDQLTNAFGIEKHSYAGNWDWQSGSGGSSGWYNTMNTGGNQPHNNMPPYLIVYVWRRIG